MSGPLSRRETIIIRLVSVGIAACALLAPISIASAQSVELGSRVRISHHCRAAYAESTPHDRKICRTTVSTLRAVTADTVYLSGPISAVPRDSIGRIEVRVRQGHLRRGAITGGLAGVALGVAVGSLAASSSGGTGSGGIGYLITSPLGLTLGAFVGASIGGGDAWREVPLEALEASVIDPDRTERQ